MFFKNAVIDSPFYSEQIQVVKILGTLEGLERKLDVNSQIS